MQVSINWDIWRAVRQAGNNILFGLTICRERNKIFNKPCENCSSHLECKKYAALLKFLKLFDGGNSGNVNKTNIMKYKNLIKVILEARDDDEVRKIELSLIAQYMEDLGLI
jgi:hypothetical protein